ncbi:MAG: hypothetical protein MZW92_28490 [Comamonadaceae bacterium]|nr:hypothetical protein [Comamonadaceae bacterium]
MLTFRKLQAYCRFDGDIDGWARSGGDADASGITDPDWLLIDELRQALWTVAQGLATPGFQTSTERRLLECTADDETRQAIRVLATADRDRAAGRVTTPASH